MPLTVRSMRSPHVRAFNIVAGGPDRTLAGETAEGAPTRARLSSIARDRPTGGAQAQVRCGPSSVTSPLGGPSATLIEARLAFAWLVHHPRPPACRSRLMR